MNSFHLLQDNFVPESGCKGIKKIYTNKAFAKKTLKPPLYLTFKNTFINIIPLHLLYNGQKITIGLFQPNR